MEVKSTESSSSSPLSASSASSSSSSSSSSSVLGMQNRGLESALANEPVNTFQQFTNFVDGHINLIRGAVIGIGITGVLLIGRSIRLMKTFRCVADIPDEFIQKQMRLRGKVRGHEKGHLEVEHLPILNTKKLIGRKEPSTASLTLPVHIAGVTLPDSNMEHLIKLTPPNTVVWFRMLGLNQDRGLECIVSKRKNWLLSMTINEELVRQGFAKVQHIDLPVHSNHHATQLMQRLIKAEKYAERKAKGMWARPSLSERVKEQKSNVQNALTQRMSSIVRPFAAGASSVKSVATKLSSVVRRGEKTER